MGFIKLPSNSEKILLELAQTENPTQTLNSHYEGCTMQEKRVLDGIVRELKECGYINVKWADNMPWIVTLNNSAITYEEALMEYESKNEECISQEIKEKNFIFISHRSTDKDIADMLLDFFAGTGIPKESVFCSSLPGNDVNESISKEVKAALKNSTINIVILSQDYYQSAYCLNEAGILWFEDDIPVVPIALPEINSGNMYGFLNSDYKLRHLDCDTDISYIYDIVSEMVFAPHTKASIITQENNKLRTRYNEYLKIRELDQPSLAVPNIVTLSEITTDDERIVLYYILRKKVRKVSKLVIAEWLDEYEIKDVNLDNAFDLLSLFEGGAVNGDILELGIESFRKYSANSAQILPELKECVDQHTKLAADRFKTIWKSDVFDAAIWLFVAYIIDERIHTFGDRWMAEGQINSIKKWERKNGLDSTLSSNYECCLKFFVQNDLVYASSWTDHGNVREYSLRPSMQRLLFDCQEEIVEELQNVKCKHYCDLPF